jgi:hypothetical protein
MAEMLGIPGPGESVQTTTEQLTPSKTSGSSRKKISPEGEDALRGSADADDDYMRSLQGLPPVATKSAADVEAEVKSQEGSRLAMERAERADVAAQPDPFAPKPELSIPFAPLPPTIAQKMGEAVTKPAGNPGRPYTSQEFNTSEDGGPGGINVLTGEEQDNARKLPAMAGGIKGPQTFADAKDEAHAYEVYMKGKAASERLAAEKQLAAEKAKREEASFARINDLAAQVEKDRDALYEKPSTWSTILGAIAQGLGAYGAGLTKGPNWAYEIIKTNQDHDLQIKKARLDASVERMKAAGANPQHLDTWAKAQQERLLAVEKAQIDATEKRVATMLAPFGQAKQAVMEQIAKYKAEREEKRAEIVVRETGSTETSGSSTEGTKQSTTTGSKDTARDKPTTAQIDDYTRAKLNADKAKELLKYEKDGNLPTPEQWSKIISNENAIIAQQAKEIHGGASAVKVGDFFRWVGVLPENIYPPDMNEQQKEAARIALEQAHALFAKRWTPGSISIPEAYLAGMTPLLPQRGETNQTVHNKISELANYAIELDKAMERVSKPAVAEEKRAAREAAAGKPSASAGAPTKEQKAALTVARQVLKFPDRFPADRVAKAKRVQANYDQMFGGK